MRIYGVKGYLHNPKFQWPQENKTLEQKTVGKKRENTGNYHFLLFPQCFITVLKKELTFQQNFIFVKHNMLSV